MSDEIVPFRIQVTDEDLKDLDERLRRTRWPDPAPVGDWSQGVPLAYAQELCRYWREDYDWRAREALFNCRPQFLTAIDDVDIHFIHVVSPEPGALPLVMTHGWPGSVVEFDRVIGPLSDPVAHGGDAADAFSVVCPSLPGYGWSGKPRTIGWGIDRTAQAWATLMSRLGYDRYGAQGGDWGAMVTTRLGNFDPEHVAGIHLNMVVAGPGPDDTDLNADEVASLELMANYQRWESGYSQQQATRPQTLGYGLADSPSGQCAWILEKFRAWSDCGDDPVTALGADRILDNAMFYWLPGNATSSARMYWESFSNIPRDPVSVPAAASIFPKEIFRPSRRWAERLLPDLRYWGQPARGGHFAAFEQPELFVEEVQAAFRTMR
jgi:pimeloyl-ACP methyl ester carboxylesterase